MRWGYRPRHRTWQRRSAICFRMLLLLLLRRRHCVKRWLCAWSQEARAQNLWALQVPNEKFCFDWLAHFLWPMLLVVNPMVPEMLRNFNGSHEKSREVTP
jgi:hypothetical protein